jgi:hypothetical protein
LKQINEGKRKVAAVVLLCSALVAGMALKVFTVDYFSEALRDIRHPSTTFMQGVDLVKTLPENSALFGQGWEGAPSIALYSGRYVANIDRFSVYDLEKIGTGYLLLDKYSQLAGSFDRILKRYESKPLLEKNPAIQIYKVDFTSRINPFQGFTAKPQELLGKVKFQEQIYGLAYGLHLPTSPDFVWATTDVELLLRYQGGGAVELKAYLPAVQFVKPGEMNIQVHINDCLLGTAKLPAGKVSVLTYQIPTTCKPRIGSATRLQIRSDNMIDGKEDLRQLSYFVSEVGYAK